MSTMLDTFEVKDAIVEMLIRMAKRARRMDDYRLQWLELLLDYDREEIEEMVLDAEAVTIDDAVVAIRPLMELKLERRFEIQYECL